MTARAKSSNVTIVDTGFPGNPKKYFSPTRPKTTGLPGWICTPDVDALSAAVNLALSDQARLEAMGEDEYAALRRGALEWARRNTTRVRATEFLRAIGR